MNPFAGSQYFSSLPPGDTSVPFGSSTKVNTGFCNNTRALAESVRLRACSRCDVFNMLNGFDVFKVEAIFERNSAVESKKGRQV